jgi:hypothetical protein
MKEERKRNVEKGTQEGKKKREDTIKSDLILVAVSTSIRDGWFGCNTEHRFMSVFLCGIEYKAYALQCPPKPLHSVSRAECP